MTTINVRSFCSAGAIRAIATLAAGMSLTFAIPAFAGVEPGYSHESYAIFPYTNWMSSLPDSMKLSYMSIPGTHDSMAHIGGDSVQTQSMDLGTQLFAGIRVVDIRIMFEFNTFGLSHGVVPQPGNFDTVMQTVSGFLQANPRETVLMRIRDENDLPGNTITFEQAFKVYWARYSSVFWTNPGKVTNPTLGELRGKVVVLQNFTANSSYGLDYSSFNSQDNYNLSDDWQLYSKWTGVKSQLAMANTVGNSTGNESKQYINYLSGATGVFPYFVASGKSNPDTGAPRLATGKTTPLFKDWPDFPRTDCFLGMCTISFEGTNNLTYNWIEQGGAKRVGIVMSDFPGPGLIQQIIGLNRQMSSY